MLNFHLCPASGLKAQDTASSEPVSCAYHLGPAKERSRQCSEHEAGTTLVHFGNCE